MISHISIWSNCLNAATVSVWEGDRECVRITVVASVKDPETDEILGSRAEMGPMYPLIVNNPRVTAEGADVENWHIDTHGILQINIG